jgi:hypothetical protein
MERMEVNMELNWNVKEDGQFENHLQANLRTAILY